jgi:hypothetical protein
MVASMESITRQCKVYHAIAYIPSILYVDIRAKSYTPHHTKKSALTKTEQRLFSNKNKMPLVNARGFCYNSIVR